jgi:hypothetical protein
MQIIYKVTVSEVRKVKDFYAEWSKDPFVLRRYERNILKRHGRIIKSQVWQAMISCLLSTQQRSGPNSSLNGFINSRPFPLTYKECLKRNDCSKYVKDVISKFGGLRRANIIGEECKKNLSWLEKEGWKNLLPKFKDLDQQDSPELEKIVANIVAEKLKGFGPKQSRNLLQSLGLTKYEIPIDSRITKWLNEFGFPVKLNATALADPAYYDFISEAFQALCKKSEIYPCLMDAAIFCSFDKGKWESKNVRW